MTRQRTAIPAPTRARVDRVPDVPSDQFGSVWRVTEAHRESPWWFSSRSNRDHDAGRFDLIAPRGTCYWCDNPVGALLERLTDPADLGTLVPASLFAQLVVWRHDPPPPERAADTTAREGGLPKEFGAGTSYERCWQWADQFDSDGRPAVRAWSRMAPDDTRTIAVFGDGGAGPRDPVDEHHPALGWVDAKELAHLVESDPRLENLDVMPEE